MIDAYLNPEKIPAKSGECVTGMMIVLGFLLNKAGRPVPSWNGRMVEGKKNKEIGN